MRQGHQLKSERRHQKSMAVLLSGIVGLIFPSVAFAQDVSAVDGLGSRTCSVVLEAKESDRATYIAFASWVHGFVSAANAYEDSTFDLTPWQTPEFTMAQIARSCSSNPSAPLVEAASAYIRFLRPSRLTEPTPLVSVGDSEIKTIIYLQTLTELKAKLDDLGLHTGSTSPEDYSPEFQTAVAEYQRANGLRVTALPDITTLAHIFQ